MQKVIAVGFGSAGVSKDGEPIWQEEHDVDWDDLWTFADAEKKAVDDPDHDWRAHLHGPLHGEVYQRHGPGRWLLVETDEGFA